MKLSAYLRQEGITQADFGKRVGVSQGMVWQWLTGRCAISAEKVLPIEKATKGHVSRYELRPDIYPRDTRRSELRA